MSKKLNKKDKYKKLMKLDYTYPSPSDENFQSKIYQKREFYSNKIPHRKLLTNYEDIKEYRDNICARPFALKEHQLFLSNFINPDSPYKGLLLYHGTGTGKCVTGSVFAYVNGQIITMEDIWNIYSSKKKVPDKDNGEWSEPIEDLIINAVNTKTMKMTKRQVKRLYKQKIKENINVIKLQNGFELKLTKAHRLLTENGWSNDFTTNKYVAIPRKLIVEEKSIGNDLAYFLGWQLSEGYEGIEHYYTQISNTNMKILNNLMKCIENVSKEYDLNINNPKIKGSPNNGKRCPILNLYSKDYVKFLENDGYVFGKRSANKRVPNMIMTATKEEIKTFIRAYYDADGYVDVKNRSLELTSASKTIMYQMFHLLKRCEINMRIKKVRKCATNGKKIMRDYYVGYIRSGDLRKFAKDIGLELDYKQENLQKICKFKTNSNINNYAVNHIIREVKDHTHLPNKVFVDKQYLYKSTREPNKNSLRKFITNLQEVRNRTYVLPTRNKKNYNIDNDYLEDKINELNNRLNGDIMYVKIESVREELHYGYVYDLEIDTHHNYVANGIIGHNTCAAITIAEKFKGLVEKYNTKIYVLTSGPLIKENWKHEILTCTGETYKKYQDGSVYVNEQEKKKIDKNAINLALQYYRFMSYRSFFRKVLGEKILEKVTKGDKVKTAYRKTDEGDYERDIAVDRIYSLDNTLIIVDEAHNLTDNDYGKALKKIIDSSTNLKVLLLTATPMKNKADDIINLMNFIRPKDAPLQRDKIFTSVKNHLMEFKPGGIDYLKNMTRGYVSHLRGADPLTFAERVEKGETPEGLDFIKVTRCKMLPFQRKVYDITVKNEEDTLDKKSEAVANFVFPGLSEDRKSLQGYHGVGGIMTLRNQLKTYYDTINKKIAKEILENKGDDTDLIYLADEIKITGKILKLENLKHFSIKFYTALKKLNRLVDGKKGAGTAFVYSNLVKVGIEMFQEILIQNGYLEYEDTYSNYIIKPDTICYRCGDTYNTHKTTNKYDDHTFHPATFITVTGKSEEGVDAMQEEKQKLITKVFNNIKNKNGKYLKFILGSSVMAEGITLENVREVHILDVHYNLGRVDQAMGRAIRYCKHYNVTNEKNKFPKVDVYKYVVSLDKGLSTEEELYRKAELKYKLIKKVERVLKTNAVDCPLNKSGNVFPEETVKYKGCGGKDNPCPAVCDYMNCEFKCEDPNLNKLFYDEKTKTYKSIPKDKLDYTTFTQELARNEINNVKKQIKNLYKTGYVYTLKQIISHIYKSLDYSKRDLFENNFVFKALDELIPISENDFNNFKDTLLDKYNKPGYIIYRNKYYIFQPFDQNENVPMYYRSSFDKELTHKLTLYNYMKNNDIYKKYKGSVSKDVPETSLLKDFSFYDFESVQDYYDSRKENFIVGIIDKEVSRRKSKKAEDLKDVFKIRNKRSKILEKKRGTGIPSLKGAVCSTSKSKDYLLGVAKKIGAKVDKKSIVRTDICNTIKERLLYLEKYSTEKNKDKLTYVMIPRNHPDYPFPYNLEDRQKYIIDKIKEKIKFKFDIKKSKKINKKTKLPIYNLEIKHSNKFNDFKKVLTKLGGKLVKGTWTFVIE